MLERLTKDWWDEYIETKMDYMGDAPYEAKKAMLVGFVDIANMG